MRSVLQKVLMGAGEDVQYVNHNHIDAVQTSSDQTVSGNKTFVDNVVVNGDIIANGNVYTYGNVFVVHSEDLYISDNVITLNDGEIGSGVTNRYAGLAVDRGSAASAYFMYDDNDGKWHYGYYDGDDHVVANHEDIDYLSAYVMSHLGSGGTGAGTAIPLSGTNNWYGSIIPNIVNVNIGSHAFPLSSLHTRDIHFEVIPAPSFQTGQLFFDNDDKTLTLNTDISGVSLQIGQEQYVRCVNKTDSTILNGQVVYISGAQGQRPKVALAVGSPTSNPRNIIGVATHNIAKNQEGFITTFGLVRDLNTNTLPVGSIIWLHPTIPGAFTKTEPDAPYRKVKIGHVIQSHLNQGIIMVRVESGLRLDCLHDVKNSVSAAIDNQLIAYSSSLSAWHAINPSLSAANDFNATNANNSDILQYINGEWVACPLFSKTNEPTGFENQTDSIISFNSNTSAFTISPTSGSYYLWLTGQRHQISSPMSVVMKNGANGIKFFFFNNDNPNAPSLSAINEFNPLLITKHAIAGTTYWNSSMLSGIYFGDERHSITMDASTHSWIHRTQGSQYVEGFALSNITAEGDGANNAHAQLSVLTGRMLDEDIEFRHANSANPGKLPVFYRVGSTWKRDAATTYPVKRFGTSRLAYNNAGAQAEVANNGFVLSHIAVTNDRNMPYIVIQGQAQYANITAARTGATTEINSLILEGLPFAEFIFIGTVIFQTSNSYSNAVKARIRTTDLGGTYVDFRDKKLTSTGSATDHGSLAGLTDPDHPASSITFSTTNTNLSSTNVQAALDELDYRLCHDVHINVTATKYTPLSGAAGKSLWINATTSANYVFIPLSTTFFEKFAEFNVLNNTIGTVSVSAHPGYTLNGVNGGIGTINESYTGVTLVKVDSITWRMYGAHEGVI